MRSLPGRVRHVLACAALGLVAACADSGPSGTRGGVRLKDGTSLGEGIFAIHLADRSVVQLAAIPGPDDASNFVKFGFEGNHGGSFDFAYVPEIEDGGLHFFTASFTREGAASSEPELKLRRSDLSTPNGPAYCTAQTKLGFGAIKETFVGLETIDAAAFRSLPSSTIEQADAAGRLTTVQSDDFQISTDLACGNLPSGLVFDHLDCHDSASVNDCLSLGHGNGISAIHFKESARAAETPLTFPEADPKIIASPRRMRPAPTATSSWGSCTAASTSTRCPRVRTGASCSTRRRWRAC